MNQLQTALRRKRALRQRLPRPPRALPPINLEKAYARAIKGVVQALREAVDKRLIPLLPGLVAEVLSKRPNERRDAAGDDFEAIIERIKIEMAEKYSDSEIRDLADRYGIKVSDFNSSQQLAALKRVVGVDIVAAEPWLAEALSNFAAANVVLIGGLTDKAMDEIHTGVLRGFSAGQRWEEISGYIEERFGVAESRADLIARDQVGKLNGQLTELRQTDLGITQFIWRTSNDERVRESHAELEGEVCDWNDPPEVDGEVAIPGEPINCRCWAEPVFDSSEENSDN